MKSTHKAATSICKLINILLCLMKSCEVCGMNPGCLPCGFHHCSSVEKLSMEPLSPVLSSFFHTGWRPCCSFTSPLARHRSCLLASESTKDGSAQQPISLALFCIRGKEGRALSNLSFIRFRKICFRRCRFLFKQPSHGPRAR